MSAGTAVAASDLDAFRRVLEDGKSGVLTPVEDSAALAAALRGLLADAGLRAQYAENARQRVMTFDWSVVANQVLRVYESAMAADPRRVAEAAE